mmetsp:Transcript_46939/g.87465  ORF Transcript_46939/g.87465 Transcript_46939/m.87465 type:complete len:386 (-) Transcript_46939:148-1305(-)
MDWREWFASVPVGTRTLMLASSTTFVMSPFFPTLMDFLACSPFYVVMRLHLWRLLTACLCPDSLLSAIVGLLLLYRYGLMLEQERGTLLFVSSCSIKVVAMNALLCLGSVLLSPVAPSLMSPLHAARGGLFPLMLALMTTQSQRGAQAGARTSFFGVFSVPTTHFPLLLLALFVLLGAHPLETSAAVGVGYLKHWGKLDRFEPSLETLTRVEALPWMEAVSRWRGFVPMSSAGATLPAYTVTNNNSNNNKSLWKNTRATNFRRSQWSTRAASRPCVRRAELFPVNPPTVQTSHHSSWCAKQAEPSSLRRTSDLLLFIKVLSVVCVAGKKRHQLHCLLSSFWSTSHSCTVISLAGQSFAQQGLKSAYHFAYFSQHNPRLLVANRKR